MSHLSPVELHDHAYGFRLSEHVASCADCRRAVDALLVERQGLKDVLREARITIPESLFVRVEAARVSRRKFSAPALIAAALLLGALAWMLFQPKMRVEPPLPPAASSTHDEDMEKIIIHLKSSSPLKQELARLALKKYGGVAVPLLQRAKADPLLIEECRGFTAEDQAAFRKLQTTKLILDWKSIPLPEAMEQLQSFTGVNFQVTGVENPFDITVTLSVKSVSVAEILDQVAAMTNLPWGRSLGRAASKSQLVDPPPYVPTILFGVQTPTPPSSLPVRVRSIRAWAATQVHLNPDPRDKTAFSLLFSRLGMTADPSLWDYLDSANAEVRDLAAQALRRLYGPPFQEPPSDMGKRVDQTMVNVEVEDVPFKDVLLDLGFVDGIALVLDPRVAIPEESTTLRIKAMSLRNTLKMVLWQKSLACLEYSGGLFITMPEWIPFQLGGPRPWWTSVEVAAKAEAVIDDLASEDSERQGLGRAVAKEAGRDGLGWINHGRKGVDQSLRPRFRESLVAQAAAMHIPLGEPLAAAYDQELSKAQEALLSRTLSLKSSGQTLEALLKEKGVKCRLRVSPEAPLLVAAPSLKVYQFLMSVLDPLGLDFYMDGDTIVVDTEQNVRAAVEKK